MWLHGSCGSSEPHTWETDNTIISVILCGSFHSVTYYVLKLSQEFVQLQRIRKYRTIAFISAFAP